MAEPIVFISRSRIKEGRAEEFARYFEGGTESLRREKSGTGVFLAFLDDEATEVAIVHVFADATAMDRHMEGAAQRASRAFEFIEPLAQKVYGPANEAVLAAMQRIAGAGVDVRLHPRYLGGFARSARG